jgi:type III restriction enzyme
MKQVIIENPTLNLPFEERRISSYFIPIAKPKKKGKQLSFDTEWTEDRTEVSGNGLFLKYLIRGTRKQR